MAERPPLVIGPDYPEQQMKITDTVPVTNGSTGKTLSDLSGQAGKFLKVNATEDGYDLATGGGGGSDGNGIYDGSGTIPDGTIADIPTGGQFQIGSGTLQFKINRNAGEMTFIAPDVSMNFGNGFFEVSEVGGDIIFNIDQSVGMQITDNITLLGLQYISDYSSTIITNSLSIPDVGTVRLISLQGANNMTTTERDALTPSEGWEIYNTTTHKKQVYDGATWQDCW